MIDILHKQLLIKNGSVIAEHDWFDRIDIEKLYKEEVANKKRGDQINLVTVAREPSTELLLGVVEHLLFRVQCLEDALSSHEKDYDHKLNRYYQY